jgi:hypothetical protein
MGLKTYCGATGCTVTSGFNYVLVCYYDVWPGGLCICNDVQQMKVKG